jgi:CheY-like chemotaxis protein
MSTPPIVLYAEDDENDAFFMERAFTKNQSAERLRIVPNGRRAIEYLAGDGEFVDRTKFPLPGLVLLDVKMPVMSGLEALAWIRARREFDGVAVVIFTSSTQDSDVKLSRVHGANGYFVKPSNADNLWRLVAELQRATATLPAGAPILAVEGNQLLSR